MSMELNVFTSGLILADTPELAVEHVESLLMPLLAERGATNCSVKAFGAAGLQVSCDGLLLWIARDGTAPRLRITAQAAGHQVDGELIAPMEEEALKALKAVTLAALARDMNAITVQWLSRSTEIAADQFISATGLETTAVATDDQATKVSVTMPRRVRPTEGVKRYRRPRPAKTSFADGVSDRLAALRAAEDMLADARDQKYSTPLRLAAWVMTIMIAAFSVPLAWVLFALNLRRGGDFRVTSNVLAGTAGLSLLHASGATYTFLNMLLG